jgi:hypothetical protein
LIDGRLLALEDAAEAHERSLPSSRTIGGMIPKRTETRLLVTFAIIIAIALVLFGIVLLGAGMRDG